MKLALVYDRVNKFGGAERVLQTLHELWPNAPLYTSVYDPHRASWADSIDVRPSFLQNIPLARKKHELFAWAMPYAFESHNLSEFDVVISVTSAEAKGVITAPKTLHISYLLTPTRYLWSHTHHYSSSEYSINSNPLTNFLRPYFINQLRIWDQVAAHRPDKIITISNTVKQRVEKFYKRDVSGVIYPSSFEYSPKNFTDNDDYYLVVSRLVPYKRIDLAIKACVQLNKQLVVVGVGSEYEKLRKIANQNVKMVGKLTQPELISYYQRCRALIFPAEEDFGLVSVEAQMFGKPIIAFKKGGAGETIVHKKTGYLFNNQTIDDLVEAIKEFENITINYRDCINNAERFSKKSFKRNFAQFVEDQWELHQHQ